MSQEEKMKLARLVLANARLLHRYNLRHIFCEEDSESCPALTPQQCQMVMAVHENGSMTMRQLTQALYVKAPAVSSMVDRLVDLGILTREENPKDRREVIVKVSVKSQSKMLEIEQRHLQATFNLFDKIGMEQARIWGTLCERIQEALEEEETSPEKASE